MPVANESTTHVKKLIGEALQGIDKLATDRKPEVFFNGIDGTNLKVTVSIWIQNTDISSYEDTKNEILVRITNVLKDRKLI